MFLMQVVVSATLSLLYYVLGAFLMFTDTLVQYTSFLIATLAPLALNVPMKSQLRSGWS